MKMLEWSDIPFVPVDRLFQGQRIEIEWRNPLFRVENMNMKEIYTLPHILLNKPNDNDIYVYVS